MKLPVFAIVRETYSFVFRSYRQFYTLALPAVVVTAIPTAITGGWLWHVLGQPKNEIAYAESIMTLMKEGEINSSDGFILLMLYTITFVLSIVMFLLYSVGWHRSYLMPSETVTARSAYQLHKRHVQFLYNYLKLALLTLLLVTLFGFAMVPLGLVAGAIGGGTGSEAGAGSVLVLVTQFAFLLGFVWFYARFALAFPATAVDNHMPLGEVMRLSRGHGWRLVASIALTALPVLAASIVLSWLVGTLSIAFGLFGSLTVLLLSGLANQIISYVGIAFGVTVLSVAYDRLRSAGAITPAGNPD